MVTNKPKPELIEALQNMIERLEREALYLARTPVGDALVTEKMGIAGRLRKLLHACDHECPDTDSAVLDQLRKRWK